ncbi:MAG: glycine cleavage system protein H [Acidobacteria bacterium]|nr:glycine cleavage system protein H [Acidobacteriota bacterium]
MTVLLVILTFALFVGLDYLVTGRRPVREERPAAVPVPEPAAPEPVWVGGYLLPEGFHYHQGHTWARALDASTVLVGIDDFARRLIGSARRLLAPARGAWLKQGEAGFRIGADGREAEFVSPVEGEVLEVNERLQARPGLATEDPFARGWILKVRVGDLVPNFRNLLSGRMAHRWIQEAGADLRLRLMALSGSVLQDGGEPAADFARQLPEEDWRRLVREFLLT